jgi:flagellar hook protein FlgE
MMMDPVQIGLSGMRAATTAVAARASNIANVNTKGYLPVEPVMKSTGDGGVEASITQPPLSPDIAQALAEMPGGAVDLTQELVQMRFAEIAYKASAKVVESANSMQDEALNLIAPKQAAAG